MSEVTNIAQGDNDWNLKKTWTFRR